MFHKLPRKDMDMPVQGEENHKIRMVRFSNDASLRVSRDCCSLAGRLIAFLAQAVTFKRPIILPYRAHLIIKSKRLHAAPIAADKCIIVSPKQQKSRLALF